MADLGAVTILWAVDAAPADAGLGAAIPPGAKVVRLAAAAVGRVAAPSLEEGAVVAVVATVDEVHAALGAGVDEAVRAEALSAAALAEAIERARLRARGRHVRDENLLAACRSGDAGSLALLGAAIGHGLDAPLTNAALNCDVLRSALESVVGLADDVVRWAVDGVTPSREEVRQIVAARLAAPSSRQVSTAIDGLTMALHEAAEVVERVCSLVVPDADRQAADLGDVAREVAELARPELEEAAEVNVETPEDPCDVPMSRDQIVNVLTALLGNALHAVREQPADASRVDVCVRTEGDLAVLEVRDNGVGMAPEVRAHALDPFFTTRRPASLGLGLTVAAVRVRRAGGEILIESQPEIGTTVRVFLPLAGRPAEAPDGSALN